MTLPPSIHTIGPPSERHADRVVALMLKAIAVDRARRWKEIAMVFKKHSNTGDGNPKAQGKMAERMRQAGATKVVLRAGKGGVYEVDIYDWSGWNADANGGKGAEIGPNDILPHKPQIACWFNTIQSFGGRKYKTLNTPVLFITHHSLSRFAQRLHDGQEGVPVTIEVKDLLKGIGDLWNAGVGLLRSKGSDLALNPPHASGWRVPFGGGIAVINKHDHRNSLIVSTILPKGAYLDDRLLVEYTHHPDDPDEVRM